jgi:mannose/fructose/N-acetylgalactosamine-specific phosphotransferase system component IIC
LLAFSGLRAVAVSVLGFAISAKHEQNEPLLHTKKKKQQKKQNKKNNNNNKIEGGGNGWELLVLLQ